MAEIEYFRVNGPAAIVTQADFDLIVEAVQAAKTLRDELTAARLELESLRRQNERLAAAVFRYACHCGRQSREISLHTTWCPYRIACTPYPSGEPSK